MIGGTIACLTDHTLRGQVPRIIREQAPRRVPREGPATRSAPGGAAPLAVEPRNRRPDSERPLVKIDGSRKGDTTVTYDRGRWVFRMLLNQMDCERALKGLQWFMRTYHGIHDHPVLQDFLRIKRGCAPDPAALDDFTRQCFFEVVPPEYRLLDPKNVREDDQRKMSIKLENVGTGTMAVDLAANRDDRFEKSGQPSNVSRQDHEIVLS